MRSSVRGGMLSLLAGLALLQRPHVQSLADAERAFARMGAELGVRDSFLHFFREDAVAFGPDGPHNAPKKLRASPISKTKREAKLVWEPICADAAGSGDLGYTFGPSSVRKISDNSLIPDSTGIYMSIWARKMGGPWKVVADIGVDNPAPTLQMEFREGPIPSATTGPREKDPRKIERALARKKGSALQEALKALVASEAAVLSKDVGPWSKGALDQVTELNYANGGLSHDLSFGYAYGTYKSPSGHGSYLHVFRRAGSRSPWRIVVVVQQPS